MKGHDFFDVSSSLLFEMEMRTSRLSKLFERFYLALSVNLLENQIELSP